MIVRILSATFEYMHFKLTRYVNLADFALYNYKKTGSYQNKRNLVPCDGLDITVCSVLRCDELLRNVEFC